MRRLCGRAHLAADAAALGPPAPVPPPQPSDVTRLVRHARRQARLSQRGLAARAGVAPSTVAEIEMGRVDPKAGTLAKLLAACDCRLVALPAGQGAQPIDSTQPDHSTQAGHAGRGVPEPHDAARLAEVLDGRLQREPYQRVGDAGPEATILISGLHEALKATRAVPIIIGELAELIWGADRRPATAQLCARADDVEPLVAALALAPMTVRRQPVASPPADAAGGPAAQSTPGDPAAPAGRAGPPAAQTRSPYDVQLAPPGTAGWADLRRAAAPVWFGVRKMLVASLDDLLRIRRARCDPADAEAIRELEALIAAVERTERAEAGAHPRFPAHWDVRPLAHLDWLLLRGRVRNVGRAERQRTLTGFSS